MRVGVDSGEDVFEVFKRIDFIGLATGDQAHEDSGGFAAAFAADEQEVLLAQNHWSNGIFRHVIIGTKTQFSQIIRQNMFLILRIGYGFAEG